MANRWLAHILSTVLEKTVDNSPVPAWDVAARPIIWDDPALLEARRAMEEIIATGTNHFCCSGAPVAAGLATRHSRRRHQRTLLAHM